MLSSARPSVPPRPRYLDGHRRNNVVEPKSTSQGHRREEKSTKITSNSANSSSVSRGSKVSAEHHKPRGSHLGRSTAGQTRVAQGKNIPATSKLKPKVAHIAPGPSSVLDPNCNEPSLPCLCCDGHSPHDSNSLYNHNYNNNNTTAIRQHLHLQPAQPHTGVGAHQKAGDTQQNPRSAVSPSHNGLDTQQRGKSEQNEEQEINELDEGEDFDNNDDDEDEDTLVPSCHDCPPSLLEFSLSSSTSSSSTSISSCSDFESDCPDINTSSFLEMSSEKNLLNGSPTSQPQIIPMGANHTVPQPLPPYSPDEGYPSARSSPSSDYIEHKASLGQETSKVNLLTYLNSSSELSKMDYWSKVVEVAQWGMEGDIALQDRLSHLEKLTLVNKQVKITYLERIRDSGLDLDEEDLSDSLDGTGNMEVTWRLYRGDSICESQEFSDAGVDLSAPSDLDEPLQPDSLAPSPLQPPPRPPKPTLRNSESHTYVNINNNIPASTASSAMTSFQTVSPSLSSSMPEKTIPAPPPLPLAPSQPIPYFTFYSSPPTLASPPPPIPPPRRRHKARLEAQKFANLQDESTPLSLPPPTSRPPPLPPPPAAPSPPAIPPPPTLPPPPSFHALDAEIRKLLVLAGLTQAELLKLSPELGVCVTGVLEEGDGELSEVVRPQIREVSTEEMGQKHDRKQVPEEECGEGKKDEGGEMKGVRRESTVGEHEQDVLREGAVQEESREAFQTTSFTEMARRRRRNNVISNCSCTYGLDNHSNPDAYYSTTSTSVIASNHDISSHNTYDYTITMASSPPPPPPPRPLPPCPPKLPQPPPLPSLSLSTLSANKARPDRSDWLIAFSPDTETPPFGADRTPEVSPQKAKVGSKVTTFKELRFRSRQNPQPLVVQPEPDPTVITPDPDVLYNLKWRKEKADGDGSQWEYLPQVQSIFLQHQLPPPLPEKREVLPVSDAGGQSQSCPSQRIGCSASDSDLWSSGATGQDESWRKKEEDEGAVRGRADGGRKWESGTTVSSPPLSLALPSPQSFPYFLHPEPQIPPLYQAGAYRAPTRGTGQNSQGVASTGPISLSQIDSLYCADPESPIDSLYCTDENSNVDSLYCTDGNSNVDVVPSGDLDRKTLLCSYSADGEGCTDTEGCTTPYRNIEAIIYSKTKRQTETCRRQARLDDHQTTDVDENCNQLVLCPVVKGPCPDPPAWYFYSPKSCPLHQGASLRLSPIGAISPPQRWGLPSPGADVSRLHSPLFPRSRTLPALSAPLYCPFLHHPTSAIAPMKEPQAPILTKQTQLYTLIRSLSFAGSAQRGSSWMEDASKNPLRGQKLSSLCLEEKRALVSAVSVAVEAVLAQFSSSRTLVQKAQSGDSTINPALGRLVLQCLCPALRALLSDGLKPHQSDLITGRRPNSPWGLVQASTQPGPNTQALYALQGRIAELPQLRHARHRFNAFLLGLLNVKLLDYWLAHLQTCEDVLATYYLPTSFMRLSHSLCQPLFEELLLLLQPLSLLTFNLDLLFQHHHLDPSSPTPSPSPRSPDVGSTFHVSPKALVFGNRARLESVSEHDYGELEEAADSWGASSGTSEGKRAGGSREEEQACQSPTPRVKVGATSQLLWVQEKELLPPGQASLSKQATQVIQQGWGAVLRWGERLGQNWGSFNTSSQVTSGGTDPQALAQNVWLGESPGSVTQPDIISHQTHGDHPFDRTPAVPWGLGRLFGASRDPRSAQTHTSSTSVSPVLPALSRRRPSHWLAPGVSTLSRMVSPTLNPVPEDRGDVSEGTKETDGEEGNPRAYRSVRTLCDHSGTGAELSFQKGEELVVLGTVDHDWVRCRRGDMEGLVPIGYTSLIM
ncbi:uncharacterized protein rusc1 isoform X1 [Paramormyrops kingsleyae]|uniref:uncharacterized protein rusc1 isoform X1 n=1 Tax=Paramormyrops kingsleyae TaxID=1676925 RepID=UPI003B97B1E9